MSMVTHQMFEHACAFADCARYCQIEPNNIKHRTKSPTKDANTALSVELGLREWFKSQNANMFDEMLNDISNAFEYWRYIYEKQEGRINLNFLVGFRDLLREVCCNQLYGKSWSEYEKGE